MKKIIYIVLLLIPFCSSYSQYWTEQASGVTVQLTSVSAYGGNTVWVCGYSGTVLRTTNGGDNWINVSGGGIGSTVQLISIWGVSSTEAVTAGYLGSDTWVWRTTNAGANWIQVFSQPGGFINGIVFQRNTPAMGFIQGDPVGGRWSLWKTTNSGASWDSTGMYLQQSGSEAGWNNSIYIGSQGIYNSGDNQIWFGTNNSRIYYTTNFGSSWTAQSTAPEINTYALTMFLQVSSCDGYAGGTNLIKTSNYGANWEASTSVGTGNFSGFVLFPIPVLNDAYGFSWYTRNTTSIYRAFLGSNWAVEYTAPAGNYRHFSQSRNGSTTCWGVRSNGGITRAAYFISAIDPVSGEIPKMFSLEQNFPNPFNPSTRIGFSIVHSGPAKLTIYNSLGAEVQTLVNEELSPGSYTAEFNAAKLPSGVYYYRLESGELTQTKKMILIK